MGRRACAKPEDRRVVRPEGVWSCAEVEMKATKVGEVKVRFCLLYFIMGMFIYCRAL